MQLDFLRDPRYSVRNVSDAIMQIPNEYSLLSQLGLFPEKGIRTTYVEVEIKKGVLHLIPTSQRGAPAAEKKRGSRQTRLIGTHFMQYNDTIRASDLQNLPAFGMLDTAGNAPDAFFEAFDAELADQVRSRMFMFEDITMLDDRSVQQVLRQVDSSALALALKGVSDSVRSKITSNLSSRAAETLLEEVELLGAVRLTQVEEAQQTVIRVIRQLEEQGQIIIRRGGDDELVV